MKSFQHPPPGVKLALDALCIMLGIKYKLVERGVGRKKEKVKDYFETAKRVLKDYNKLLNRLEKFDKENIPIPEDRLQKIEDYLDNPKFVVEEVHKAGVAAEGLCKWVRAICKYDVVFKEIQPKREALATAQQKLDVISAELDSLRQELRFIEDEIDELEHKFKKQNSEKQNLIESIKDCTLKHERALDLTNRLSGEKTRWNKSAKDLVIEKGNLVGDILLSVGMISYFGPFLGKYRKDTLDNWTKQVKSLNLPCSDDFSLKKTVVAPIQIQEWLMNGLPSNTSSIQNAIIMKQTTKYSF